MKRFISFLLVIVMALAMFAGCSETHVVTPIVETEVTAPTGPVPSPEAIPHDFLYNWGMKDFTFTIRDYEFDEENLTSSINIYIRNNTEHDLWVSLDDIVFNNFPPMDWGTKVAAKTEREITVVFDLERIVSMTADFTVTYKLNEPTDDEYLVEEYLVDEYIDINFA